MKRPQKSQKRKKPLPINKFTNDLENYSPNKEQIIALLKRASNDLAQPNFLPYTVKIMSEVTIGVKLIKECLNCNKGHDAIKQIIKTKTQGKEIKNIEAKAISLLKPLCSFGEMLYDPNNLKDLLVVLFDVNEKIMNLKLCSAEISPIFDAFDKVLRKTVDGAKYDSCLRYMYIFSVICSYKY